jgi:hypothetical protein
MKSQTCGPICFLCSNTCLRLLFLFNFPLEPFYLNSKFKIAVLFYPSPLTPHFYILHFQFYILKTCPRFSFLLFSLEIRKVTYKVKTIPGCAYKKS